MTFVGGGVFWILVILAVVAIITYFERLMDIRRAQMDYQDFIKGVVNILETGNDTEALSVCEDVGAPVSNIVATAIRHRGGTARLLRDAVDSQGRAEVGRLDRRLAVLAIIGQIAPSLGLLGAVIGLIKTVWQISTQTPVLRMEMLSFSMEALISAALGLGVSIMVTVLYGSLRVRMERAVVELEAAASEIIGYLSVIKDREIRK